MVRCRGLDSWLGWSRVANKSVPLVHAVVGHQPCLASVTRRFEPACAAMPSNSLADRPWIFRLLVGEPTVLTVIALNAVAVFVGAFPTLPEPQRIDQAAHDR